MRLTDKRHEKGKQRYILFMSDRCTVISYVAWLAPLSFNDSAAGFCVHQEINKKGFFRFFGVNLDISPLKLG